MDSRVINLFGCFLMLYLTIVLQNQLGTVTEDEPELMKDFYMLDVGWDMHQTQKMDLIKDPNSDDDLYSAHENDNHSLPNAPSTSSDLDFGFEPLTKWWSMNESIINSFMMESKDNIIRLTSLRWKESHDSGTYLKYLNITDDETLCPTEPAT